MNYLSKYYSLAFIFIFLFPVCANSTGIVESLDYSFPDAPLLLNDRLVLDGVESSLAAAGGPELPMISKTYKYPAGTKLNGLEIEEMTIRTTKLDRALEILPMKPTVSGGISGNLVTNPLQGADFYPDRWTDLEVRQGLDPETMRPTVFATVRIYPVRVNGTIVHSLSVIRTALCVTPAKEKNDRQNAAMFIVAPQSFLDVMSDYITHKNDLNISIVSRSLEDITANETGRDVAEKIKYAIHNIYEEEAIAYVLLAGDADQIPVRYTFHADYGGMSDWQNIPADLYYADLYSSDGKFCSWDNNGNDIFGEYNAGDIDGCDLIPDVMVGRIPASDTTELLAALNKIIHYEDSVTGTEEWVDRIVLAGADTFTEESHGDTTGVPEGEATKELIADESLVGYDLVKLYETERYDRTDELTTVNLKNAIEYGALYVNFANHGWVQGWAFDGGFSVDDVDTLSNYDKLPIAFGYACSTGVFDTENTECPSHGTDRCLAEAFLLNPNGGSVGYYGATRTAFAGGYGLGGHLGAFGLLDRSCFQGVGAGHAVQGRLYLVSLTDLVLVKGLADTADYITALEFEYFGDPSMSAGGTPENPDFRLAMYGMDDSAGGNDNGCVEPGETVDFRIQLVNDGLGAENVSITLTIDDPDVTVVNGTVQWADFPRGTRYPVEPALRVDVSPGSAVDRSIPISFAVTWDGGTCGFQRELVIGNNAYLLSNQIWITSDNNNDNIASAGEHVNFAPALTNIGCITASGVVGAIEITDAWVTNYGVRGTGVVPDIQPGETLIPQKLFFVEIDPLTPADHIIMCHITLTETDRDQVWIFDLPIPVKDVVMPFIDKFMMDPVDPEPGDTVSITVRAEDGSGVAEVKAILNAYESETIVTAQMYDDGAHNDGAAGDGIFGAEMTLPDQTGYQLIDIYARDNLDNDGIQKNVGGIVTIPFISDDHILVVCGADDDFYLGLFTQALEDAGYGYDVWSFYRGVPPESVLNKYIDGAIVLFYSHTHPFLNNVERDAIDYYIANGGNLFITEQDIGWAMVEEGTNETEQWYRDTLLADYINDSSELKQVHGTTSDFTDLDFSIEAGSGAMNQDWPSLIDPISPAETCFTYNDYSGPNTGTAGIRAVVDDAKLVYLAFGFEGISTQDDRMEVMEAIMTWFDIPVESRACPFNQSPGWWNGPEIPIAASYAGSAFCTSDMRIYRAAGMISGNIFADPSIYYIDTQTHQGGDTGTDLENKRCYNIAACLEDHGVSKIYFIGGLKAPGTSVLYDIEVFNPGTGSISTLTSDPLPEEIDGIPGSWAVVGNKCYLIALARLSAPYQSGKTWVFDPMAAAGEKWSVLDSELDNPRFFSATAVLDGKIYLMGGLTQITQTSTHTNETVSVLDTTADVPEWEDDVAAPLPEGLFFCAGVAVPQGSNTVYDGKILVAGGMNANQENMSFIYDPTTDTWLNSWPLRTQRLLDSPLCLVPTARGPSVWAVGGFFQTIYANTEVRYLGSDSTAYWIGIRTCPDYIPAGCTLKVAMDIAGDKAATSVDCYVAMEIFGVYYFMIDDPVFPTFTEQPLPFFTDAPIPEDITYCGPLFEFPIPDTIPTFSGTFYAATLISGTGELAGGLSWSAFTISGM